MMFRFNRSNHNDQGWSVTDRNKKIREIEAKIRAEEDIQRIEQEAYRLWKADGRPEGKEDDYRRLAIHKIKTEESLINKVKKVLVNNRGQILVKGGTILTILARVRASQTLLTKGL